MNIPDIFSDIDPIPQSDGPEPACAITYTPEFVEAHDYLRAVLKVDERSERAFDLTTICLKFNPANYTVWHYRRRCLAALCAPTADGRATIDADRIDKDLDFADKLGGTNPKNYQLWYHRRALLEILFTEESASDKRMQIAQKELDYVDKILNDDNKNYHSWSHRQWIIRTINQPQLWSAEIDYSHKKILLDPRNNSAWNQRWFATHEGQNARKLSFVKAEEEANYAICGAQVDPFNESPWRYLIGVFLEQWRLEVAQSEEKEEGVADKDKVSNLLREYINKMKEMNKVWDDPPEDYPSGPCVSLISALVDLLETVGDKSSLEEAKTLMGELVKEDPVRRKYWQKRQNTVMSSLEKC
jgi:protein farnesyltransferase/geranylgeranyltransferase type-1 subunit alpha